MAVKLFRSNEVGAPQMGTTASGDLLNILRACLVEGFGSRTPSGWTMPFSDLPNKIACFKSVTGDTIRLDDSNEYRFASVLGFKAMSDLNTGAEQYPDVGQIPTDYEYRVFKRESASSLYDNWMVIASDNWFYFIGLDSSPSPSGSCGFFFGEYESLNPSFTGNHILTGYLTAESSTSASGNEYALYTAQPWFSRRNYQESIFPEPLKMRPPLTSYQQPNPFTGSLEMEKPWLSDNNGSWVRYGNFPNHYRILGSTNVGYKGGETFNIDTKNYIVLAHSGSAYAIEYDTNVG